MSYQIYYWETLSAIPYSSEGNESACNAGDLGLIPGWESREGNSNLLQYLAWEIPWTEEPGGLQSKGSQKCWTMKLCYSYTPLKIIAYATMLLAVSLMTLDCAVRCLCCHLDNRI